MGLFLWLPSAAIIALKGSDAWWYMKVEDLLPEKYRDQALDYEKGMDTMDVWFDSGIIRPLRLQALFTMNMLTEYCVVIL